MPLIECGHGTCKHIKWGRPHKVENVMHALDLA
jgi:hypothetical protein